MWIDKRIKIHLRIIHSFMPFIHIAHAVQRNSVFATSTPTWPALK